MSQDTSSPIRVSELPKNSDNSAESTPAHWANKKGTAFINPWPSWRAHDFKDLFSLPFEFFGNQPSIPKNITELLLIRKPTWGFNKADVKQDSIEDKDDSEKIRATWLGHACFLVELPRARAAGIKPLSRGARVLFDPVFSDRCSPFQHLGPKRYTPAPCKLEDIPEFDAIVISHNHYDHLDTDSIQTLTKRPRCPHVFAPLGNQEYFHSLGLPKSHVHILDWWDSRRLQIQVGKDESGAPETAVIDITCTPGQHFTGRGVLDRFKSLWASWAVETVDPTVADKETTATTAGFKSVKVWFGGDTGYRAVLPGQDPDTVPFCPAFKDIGKRFGGFDLAMIPIGAYEPRRFMSPIHCSPADSVLVYKDILAKRALGMHWGAWVLTTEEVLDPPKRLAEECKKVGIDEGLFSVCDIGETVLV